MKTDEEIKADLLKRLDPKKTPSKEEVSQACQAMAEEASIDLGAGIYIRCLDAGPGVVEVLYRRPALGQRVTFLVEVEEVEETSQHKSKAKKRKDDTKDDTKSDAGSKNYTKDSGSSVS